MEEKCFQTEQPVSFILIYRICRKASEMVSSRKYGDVDVPCFVKETRKELVHFKTLEKKKNDVKIQLENNMRGAVAIMKSNICPPLT